MPRIVWIILDFVVMYVLLVGLGMRLGPESGPSALLLFGAIFVALGLTYFWVAIRGRK